MIQQGLVAVLGLVLLSGGGCSRGIQWRGLTFDPVHADARRDNKLTFVYFRHWAVIACTSFEENVLMSPRVLEALQSPGSFYAVVLDAYADRALARDWGIEDPPGVVVLDPKGRVLAVLSGKITIEELASALERAVAAYPAASQPARAP